MTPEERFRQIGFIARLAFRLLALPFMLLGLMVGAIWFMFREGYNTTCP